MFSFSKALKGDDELESKILNIKPKKIANILLDLGAELEGRYEIREIRYEPTETMRQEDLRSRLRLLVNDQRDSLEIVVKQKFLPESIPGFEEFGKVIKKRKEYEREIASGRKSRSTYKFFKALFAVHHNPVRAETGILLDRYLLGKIRYEIQWVLWHKTAGEKHSKIVPPPFLEIEVPKAERMVDAVHMIERDLEDLSPITKLDHMANHRLQEELKAA